MIELKIDGVCKECPFKDIALNTWDYYNPAARCKHDTVCKFIGDPDGKARMREAAKAVDAFWDEVD